MRTLISSISIVAAAALIGVCFLSIGGCGKQAGPQVVAGDPGAIDDLVALMSDSTGNKTEFAKLFVEGKVPSEAQRKKYGGGKAYRLADDSTPEVSGSTATFQVTIFNYTATGDLEESMVTWTAAKQPGAEGEDEWKLTDAPLQ